MDWHIWKNSGIALSGLRNTSGPYFRYSTNVIFLPWRKRQVTVQGNGTGGSREKRTEGRGHGNMGHGKTGHRGLVNRTLRTGDGMTRAGMGRKDGKIGLKIGTQGGDSRTGYKRKGIKARERGEKTRGKKGATDG